MTEQTAILTAATASSTRERQAVTDALRHSPFAQMIGQSWSGARILIETRETEDLEHVVTAIRTRVEQASGIRYRRDA